MSEYYYFAASLPMLRMDRNAPMSYASFMAQAEEHLSAKDYRDLKLAVFSPAEEKASLPVVRDWQNFTLRLQRAVNKARAERLGFSGWSASNDKEMDEKAREIVSMNPLEGERAMLSLSFDFLSSRESGSPFSSSQLMIYALKLQILERSSAFDKDKGRAEFDKLYSDIEGKIKR